MASVTAGIDLAMNVFAIPNIDGASPAVLQRPSVALSVDTQTLELCQD